MSRFWSFRFHHGPLKSKHDSHSLLLCVAVSWNVQRRILFYFHSPLSLSSSALCASFAFYERSKFSFGQMNRHLTTGNNTQHSRNDTAEEKIEYWNDSTANDDDLETSKICMCFHIKKVHADESAFLAEFYCIFIAVFWVAPVKPEKWNLHNKFVCFIVISLDLAG